MANSATVARFLELVKIDYSDPHPFAVGYLGSMVNESELLDAIAHMERKHSNA